MDELFFLNGFIPGSRVEDVKRIAVLRANALGDFIFILPALDALKKAYPGAEVVLLGQAWHKKFLDERPTPINRVLVVPDPEGMLRYGTAGPDASQPFIAALNREHFDIAIQMYGGGRFSNPFLSRIRARVRIGLRAYDAPADGLDAWIPYHLYHPEVLRYLELVRLVGAEPVGLQPRLPVTREDIREARDFLPPRRSFIVLHPGASEERRRWPPEHFAAVARRLGEEGLAVVVTGSEAESFIAEKIRKAGAKEIINACGRLSLNGLAGLLSLSSLVISNDTGPLHLARAVGAPTVGLYWAGNVICAGPVTLQKHRRHLAWRTACPVCGADCTRNECGHQVSFVSEIPVEEVLVSAMSLLNEDLVVPDDIPGLASAVHY